MEDKFYVVLKAIELVISIIIMGILCSLSELILTVNAQIGPFLKYVSKHYMTKMTAILDFFAIFFIFLSILIGENRLSETYATNMLINFLLAVFNLCSAAFNFEAYDYVVDAPKSPNFSGIDSQLAIGIFMILLVVLLIIDMIKLTLIQIDSKDDSNAWWWN